MLDIVRFKLPISIFFEIKSLCKNLHIFFTLTETQSPNSNCLLHSIIFIYEEEPSADCHILPIYDILRLCKVIDKTVWPAYIKLWVCWQHYSFSILNIIWWFGPANFGRKIFFIKAYFGIQVFFSGWSWGEQTVFYLSPSSIYVGIFNVMQLTYTY